MDVTDELENAVRANNAELVHALLGRVRDEWSAIQLCVEEMNRWLHVAARKGSAAVVRVLLETTVLPEYAWWVTQEAANMASAAGHLEVVRAMGELCEWLHPDEVFDGACGADQVEIVRYLLSLAGVNRVDASDISCGLAIHAVTGQHDAVIRDVLSRHDDARVDAACASACGMRAVQLGFPDTLRAVLSAWHTPSDITGDALGDTLMYARPACLRVLLGLDGANRVDISHLNDKSWFTYFSTTGGDRRAVWSILLGLCDDRRLVSSAAATARRQLAAPLLSGLVAEWSDARIRRRRREAPRPGTAALGVVQALPRGALAEVLRQCSLG